jgi:signal transduction histidine kinase
MTAARKVNPSITRVDVTPDPSSEAAQKPVRAWNKKILVVDDEIEITKTYIDILSPKKVIAALTSSRQAVATKAVTTTAFDFEVTTVHTSADALKAVKDLHAKGERFAMGFFDVRLGGGLDGVDLVSEVFKIMPDMYSVFVTAYNDRTIDSIDSVLGAVHAGHWDYMSKPFNASEILQKARNLVALWNLQRENEAHNQELSELHRQVLASERVSSVAAVARGVAHEFGNLLMQILGQAEVSRNKPEGEMRAAFGKIIDASQRAHEILDRFNNLSDTKSVAAKKTWEPVEKIVGEAMDLLSHQFRRNSIKINFIKTDSVKAYVHSTSLLQVLVNLFINSLHAMGDSGQIDITLKYAGETFELLLRDYGPGVKPELLEKILEPFFTTKGENGTGLGLAICKEIIEIDHGGEFKVFNHSEKGFCVFMQVPIPHDNAHKGEEK